jgi:thioredoxin 1
MKNKNLWRIVLPLVILAVLGGIWFFKNKPKDMTEQAKPPVNADFALHAKSIDLEKLKSYGLPIMIDFGPTAVRPAGKWRPYFVK